MKRIAITVVTVLMSLAAFASPVHYFTRSQANRAVDYLNRQNEVMIYCGYDYEIETYVLVNEIWAEPINSAYYELWIYGYDAYTGEEVYMPLELQCVWLFSAGRMYNAAQYLRFRTSGLHTPQIVWTVPEYRPFTRVVHHHGYVRTYHYDVHRHGWRPPTPPAPHVGPGTSPPPPIHPYYMRDPHTPAPRPAAAWTPGVERPRIVNDAAGRTDAPRTGATTVTTRPAETPNSGTSRTGSTSGNTRNAGSTNTSNSSSNSRNNAANQTVSGRTGATTTTTNTNNNNGSRNSTGTTTTGNSRSGATTNTTTNNGRSGATTTSSSSTTSAPARATNSTTPTRATTRSSTSSTSSTTATSSNSSNSRATNSNTRTTTSSSSNTRNSSTSTTSNTRNSTSTSSSNNTRNSGNNTGSRNAGRR